MPSAVIKNTCLIVCRLLSHQFWLFKASIAKVSNLLHFQDERLLQMSASSTEDPVQGSNVPAVSVVLKDVIAMLKTLESELN